KHLERLVLRELPLELLLCAPERAEQQRERVATLVVAREPRLLQLALDVGDEGHSNPGRLTPPRTCQCRWNTVWPPPSPTLTMTRESSRPSRAAVSAMCSRLRSASSDGNSATARNVSTCRSGSTRRWVAAFGAMSRIATNP